MSAAGLKKAACLWAGIVIGGSLIAAPAKFEAPSLTLETALEVGRAQFLWLGFAEAAICAVYLALLVSDARARWLVAVWPAILLAVQRLAVMPALDARTLQVIAGDAVGPSSLHLVYVALELAKLLALAAVGFGALERARAEGASIGEARP